MYRLPHESNNELEYCVFELEDLVFVPYIMVTTGMFYSKVDARYKTASGTIVARYSEHPEGCNFNTDTIGSLYHYSKQMIKQVQDAFLPIKILVPKGKEATKDDIGKTLLDSVFFSGSLASDDGRELLVSRPEPGLKPHLVKCTKCGEGCKQADNFCSNCGNHIN